jgi:hypothetical protein
MACAVRGCRRPCREVNTRAVPIFDREEPSLNGTGCRRKACSYKPATRRGAGSPLRKTEGRRKRPDEDAAWAC